MGSFFQHDHFSLRAPFPRPPPRFPGETTPIRRFAQTIYPEGTNFIPLTVQTFHCGTNTPMPNSPAAVWIFTGGTSRSLPVTTDVSGNGTVIFPPLPTEVGLVQYGVALPGQSAPMPTGSFTIVGMNLSAQSESPQVIRNAGKPEIITIFHKYLTSLTTLEELGLRWTC